MTQLTPVGSGHPGSAPRSGSDRAMSQGGLAGLLRDENGAAPVFSGELQAMLMQLTPQMLQRLEGLVTGGMTLPQAANSLLAEHVYGGPGDTAGWLLEDRLAVSGDRLADLSGPAGRKANLVQLLGNLGARGDAPADLARMLAAPAAGTGAQISAPATPTAPLSASLAANLLDMGIPQQVGGRGWDSAIADRVMWMVQGEQQVAKLRLNPPNLGPIEVRVTVHQDQTSVSFLAQQAAVREALEAALPRLREMFDQQSLQLVRADVRDPGEQQRDAADGSSAQPQPGQERPGREAAPDSSEPPMPLITVAADSLIDLFA